jgi:monoamine oxidase
MVELAQRQLAEMPGIAVHEPYSAAWMDWSADPYGGAFYSWNVGVDADATAAAILQPDPTWSLYVCGEAYSHDQGWVEGALDAAELAPKSSSHIEVIDRQLPPCRLVKHRVSLSPRQGWSPV